MNLDEVLVPKSDLKQLFCLILHCWSSKLESLPANLIVDCGNCCKLKLIFRQICQKFKFSVVFQHQDGLRAQLCCDSRVQK